MNKDIKYAEAITVEGYLKKESPGIFKLYKNRFYTIRDKGNFLIWFKKKPMSHDESPQGLIKIAEIDKIEKDSSDKTIFYMHYNDRNFKLKAQTEESVNQWINALTYIKEYNKNIKKQPGSPTKKGWKWEDTEKELVSKIQIENEQIFIGDTENNDDQINPEKLKQSIRQRGVLQNIELSDLMDRILVGFLFKKGKLTIHNFKLRWFFLLSNYNLKNQQDRRSLSFEEIPQWLQLNTIYYFDDEQKVPKGHIKVLDCRDIEVDAGVSPYKIKMKVEVDEKDRQYIFCSRYLSEVKKWEKGIKSLKEREEQNAKSYEKRIAIIEKEEVIYEIEVSCEFGNYIIIKNRGILIFRSKSELNYKKAKLIEVGQISNHKHQGTDIIINIPQQKRLKFIEQLKAKQANDKLDQIIENNRKIPEQSVQSEQKKTVHAAQVQNLQQQEQVGVYLGKKARSHSKGKNYYELYDRTAQNKEGEIQQSKPVQQSFWTRLTKMFCGIS